MHQSLFLPLIDTFYSRYAELLKGMANCTSTTWATNTHFCEFVFTPYDRISHN
jgi:hypothetical protein